MRCPKCGYISFDHNQICPKCNKDISDEQAKLNLPTYKNNPPALLGMLVGAGDESNVGFTLDSDAALRSSGVGLDFDEASSMMEGDDFGFEEDDQDLEISLNDDTGEFELPEVDMDDLSGDGPDIDLGDEEADLEMDEASFEDSDETSDDLDLDLGEVSLEDGDEGGDVADSLDGISPDDSLVLDGVSDSSPDESADETIEIGSVSGEEARPGVEGHSTVELNVSDLKINETGELEINSIPDEIYAPKNLPEEEEIKIDKIDIDSEDGLDLEEAPDEEADDKNETGSLELGDLAFEGDEGAGDEDKMNSETMDMGAVADDDGLDLGELSLDDDSGDKAFDLSGLNLDNNETGELSLSDIEENASEKGAPAGSEETVAFDDSLTIDLENLDLDLDLDDSDDKK